MPIPCFACCLRRCWTGARGISIVSRFYQRATNTATDSMPALYALSGIRLTIISKREYHRPSIYQLLIYPTPIEQGRPMIDESLPLTPAELQILLSLADGEQHGYGIMQEVAGRTDGRTKIGPGTLYGTIKRLL